MRYKSFEEHAADVADYFGFSPSVDFVGHDGRVFTIPNPGLLDDGQQERWDELQLLAEDFDKDEDGEPIRPYRINGELLRPSYSVRLATAVFGEAGYAEFKAAGGSGNRVAQGWAQMDKEYRDHQAAE